MNKQTLTGILIALVVILSLVLYALLGRSLLGQRALQANLDEQIAIARAALEKDAQGAQVMETRRAELATAQAELALVQFSFPTEVDSTAVLAHIYETAVRHRVNWRSVQARPPATTTPSPDVYVIYAYDAIVEGPLENIVAFLTDLESSSIRTLTLDQIKLQALPTLAATLTPTPRSPTPTATATPPPPQRSTRTPFPTVVITPTTPAPMPTDPPLYSVSVAVVVYIRPAISTLTPSGALADSSQPRPDQIRALLDQARQQGNWEYAISLLLTLRQLEPSDPSLDDMLVEAYIREGQRRLAAGQYEQAAADFRAALTLRPNASEALSGLELLDALTPTPTLVPTLPPTPTLTPTPGPSPTPTPTRSAYRFTATISKQVSPYGCNWSGLAGVVYDLEGKPLVGYIIHVKGDAEIDRKILSGSSQFKSIPAYGESSWDIPINASGLTAGVWYVRLYQPGAAQAISEEYEVRLEAMCGANFAFIRFEQNH